jgi:hypothetical protein
MAPKVKSATVPPVKAAKRKAADEKEEAEVTASDQSNFSTQMNNAAKSGQLSPDQEAVWSKYKTLGRFDKDKKALISQWKMDKSCKWLQHFSKSQEKTASVECETVSGWGTRHPFLVKYIIIFL